MTSPTITPATHRSSSHFRPDIEGMRAVAIGLVLLYHAGLPWVPGGFVGVDIFFVISGFLITGLLLREIDSTGRFSLAHFWMRRAKRLLPATTVVLVATAVLTHVFLPITDRSVFGWDIVSAAIYIANWRFADRAVDYLAEGIGASPVQHFWSLAVEEQFYVVWPLVLLLVLLVARRTRVPARTLMAVALVLVAVPSFVWSDHATAESPQAAFFTTTTRLWELAVGAGLALAVPLIKKMNPAVGSTLAGLGLVAIAASALVFDATTAWPGSAAVGPVLGAAAVIAGGLVAPTSLASWLLSRRIMVWLGGISYSLYLWHWPLLVAATAYWDDPISVKRALAVVLVAVIPAWVCHVLVENPIRFSARLDRPALALSFSANLTAIGMLAGIGVALLVPSSPTAADGAAPPVGADTVRLDPAGAGMLWTADTAERIVPAPEAATKDVPISYPEGCQQNQKSAKVIICEYGDPSGDDVIALVGDSKALQWQPVLDSIGKEHGWKIISMTKSACGFHDGAVEKEARIYSSCVEWNQQVLEEVLKLAPDVVLTSSNSSRALSDPLDVESEATEESMVEGLRSHWATLSENGIPVVSVANNAIPEQEVYKCVAEHRDELSRCSFEPNDNRTAAVQRAAAELVPGTPTLSMNDVVCPGGMCPAVMGDVLVYRTDSHLTKTFVDSTKNILEPRLVESLEAAAPTRDW